MCMCIGLTAEPAPVFVPLRSNCERARRRRKTTWLELTPFNRFQLVFVRRAIAVHYSNGGVPNTALMCVCSERSLSHTRAMQRNAGMCAWEPSDTSSDAFRSISSCGCVSESHEEIALECQNRSRANDGRCLASCGDRRYFGPNTDDLHVDKKCVFHAGNATKCNEPFKRMHAREKCIGRPSGIRNDPVCGGACGTGIGIPTAITSFIQNRRECTAKLKWILSDSDVCSGTSKGNIHSFIRRITTRCLARFIHFAPMHILLALRHVHINVAVVRTYRSVGCSSERALPLCQFFDSSS